MLVKHVSKEFKYHLCIVGTIDQLKPIAPKLESLGYYFDPNGFSSRYMERGSDKAQLVTNFLGTNGNASIVISSGMNERYNRLILLPNELDLILALAAMVNDDKFYVGEYVVAIHGSGNHEGAFKADQIYKLTKVNGNYLGAITSDFKENSWTNRHFRKATKEEIIKHWSKKDVAYKVFTMPPELKTPSTYQALDKLREEWSNTMKKGMSVNYGHEPIWGRPVLSSMIMPSTVNEKIKIPKSMTEGWKLEMLGDFVGGVDVADGVDECVMNVFKIDLESSGLGRNGISMRYAHAMIDELVIPKNMKEERILIGYNFKPGCEKYAEAVMSITGAVKESLTNNPRGIFAPTSTCEIRLKEANVLHIWFEPVYKTMIERVTLRHKKEDGSQGTFEIEVSKAGIFYRPEGKALPVGQLKYLIEKASSSRTANQISEYRFAFQVTHIDSGCKKQVPIEDWQKVLDAYDKF